MALRGFFFAEGLCTAVDARESSGFSEKRKNPAKDLLCILAYVPDGAPNIFFLLTQEQSNKYSAEELARLGRPEDYPASGILWKQVVGHEDD